MRRANALDMANIAVLAMYSRQKVIISTLFTQLAKRLGLPRSAFPIVSTADSFQSHERQMIILDPVVTDDLGFVEDEYRMNMACTRARDIFVLVGSKSTMLKGLENQDADGKDIPADRFISGQRKVVEIGGVR